MIKNIPLDQIPKIFHKPTLSFLDLPEDLTKKHGIVFTDGDSDGLGKASYAAFDYNGVPVFIEFLWQHPNQPEGVLRIPTDLMESQGKNFLDKFLKDIPLNITWSSPLIN